MKKQLVVFYRKSWGCETFLHIGVGYFFSGRTPPRGEGYEKTVIPRFFCAPPLPWRYCHVPCTSH